MEQPRTEPTAHPSVNEKLPPAFIFPALVLYLALRIFSWLNTSLLESRDSMSMIRDAKAFLSLDLSRIINMPPDTAPIYPLMSALFSLPGWSVENGARLCSMFFSLVVFVSVAGIGKRLTSHTALFFSLLLLAVNPAMVTLSRSVLTEPAYIGLVYFALLLFLRLADNPTWKSGALLGGIFALTFLTRTEGLIFLVVAPFLQIVHTTLFTTERNYKKYFLWAAAFVVSFGAISAPQVWRVSERMGHFAINGRQVWEVILNNPDGKSYDQKIYGLDYSPQQINLEYIQSHPETVKAMASSVSIADLLHKMAHNIIELFRKKLFVLIGPVGVVLAACGLFALFREKRFAGLVWIVGFLSACLAGPFLHDVDVRHIAVIAPMLVLLHGVGIIFVCNALTNIGSLRDRAPVIAKVGPYFMLLIILIDFITPLRAALLPPRVNRDYAIDDYKTSLPIVQQMKQQNSEKELRVAARKGYFAYMADTQEAFLPFTNYFGLMEYCRLNRVDIILIELEELRGYPFYKNFTEHETPNLELLDRYESKSQGVFELYRVLAEPLKKEDTHEL